MILKLGQLNKGKKNVKNKCFPKHLDKVYDE